MIHPSYADLMKVVNQNVEEGEEPVVQSRYSIVLATSKRAREIIAGDEPLIEGTKGMKPLAVEELYEGKIKIISDDEEDEKEEAIINAGASAVFDDTSEDEE